MQVMGGTGVTRETIVEQVFREIRAFRIYDGPTEVHLCVVAKRIKEGDAWSPPLLTGPGCELCGGASHDAATRGHQGTRSQPGARPDPWSRRCWAILEPRVIKIERPREGRRRALVRPTVPQHPRRSADAGVGLLSVCEPEQALGYG